MADKKALIGKDGSKLPSVPETVLKRYRDRIGRKRKTLTNQLKTKRKALKNKHKLFKKAEKFIQEYRNKERDQFRLIRLSKNGVKHNLVPAEPKLAFVIRTRGINQMAPKVQKILKLFRLREINNGIFLKLNKATINMLRICEPFVTWGYPNIKSVRELIYKRGFAKIKGRRVPITNNRMIQQKLGEYGIICIEDLVHSIFTTDKSFQYSARFFSTFKLNNPSGGWERKTTHYSEGGDYGNREDAINKLLRKMV